MPLAMELFLLVRHTHPPLRMKMEDIHTRTHKSTRSHNHIHADGELLLGLVQT